MANETNGEKYLNIIPTVPLLTGLILILEMLPIYLYYSKIQYEILYYFTFSDLFNGFLIHTVHIFIMFATFYYFFILTRKKFWSAMWGVKHIAIGILLLFITGYIFYFQNRPSYTLTTTIFCLLGLTMTYYLFHLTRNDLLRFKISHVFALMFFTGVSYVGMSTYLFFDIHNDKVKHISSRNISLALERDTIKPYDKNFVIGITSNYYIIENDSSHMIRMIKATDVKDLRIFHYKYK